MMSVGNENSQIPAPAEGPERGVVWSKDVDGEVWHDDSEIPAAEALSDFASAKPEELEVPESVADDDAEEASVPEEAEAAEASEPLAESEEKANERRRSKTIARKQMLRDRRRMIAQGTLPEVLDYERPVRRSECRDDKRPCLYVSCRYHLYLDVNPVTGSIKINFPEKEVWELEETCALDVAERGGVTLEEVGEIMNLTRERIRQVEVNGLGKLKDGEAELQTFLDGRELPVGPGRLPIVDD